MGANLIIGGLNVDRSNFINNINCEYTGKQR